jgi:hypothetical protein
VPTEALAGVHADPGDAGRDAPSAQVAAHPPEGAPPCPRAACPVGAVDGLVLAL